MYDTDRDTYNTNIQCMTQIGTGCTYNTNIQCMMSTLSTDNGPFFMMTSRRVTEPTERLYRAGLESLVKSQFTAGIFIFFAYSNLDLDRVTRHDLAH